jgi:predicted Zn-dependent peptidase
MVGDHRQCIETVFGKHPLAHEILGEKETIAGLPRDTMVDYRDRRYAASNMTLIASGAIDAEALLSAAGRYCGHWPRSRNGSLDFPAPPPLPSGVRKHNLPQFNQQTVILLYPSANRDAKVFADPFRFDVARTPNEHIAFGLGGHFCLGSNLARLELRVFFEEALPRLPHLALASNEPPPLRPSNFVSGIESLPVTC